VAVQLQKAGINVVTVIREGAAGENIVEYAKEQDINLIVMSTHGRSGFKRFFVGSVTDRVIRSGETPVLVLPALSASSRL
jgi:nucleotide-binding universal stress UspA family protein